MDIYYPININGRNNSRVIEEWEENSMKYNRVAVISDIHANLDALYSFIEYIEQEKIEIVLNLGDYISGGPCPCEVFDILMKDKRFINIRGYDEESIFCSNKINQGIGQGKWLLEKLGKERVTKLKEIPNTKLVQVNDKKFLMCHHNGWSDIEQDNAHSYKYRNKTYDYLLYGGTHLQELSHSIRNQEAANIIDPGSLGGGEDNRAFFAILDFQSTNPIINFHSIDIEGKDDLINKAASGKSSIILNEKVEEESVLKETFLYIQVPQNTKDGVMYINDEVVRRVIEIGIRQCRYVSIGCWSNENQIIKEILYYLKCRRIKNSEQDDQEWYIGEITREVIYLLLHKRKLPSGRLKWFEISFYNTLEDSSPVYSIFHYGKKSFLKKLSKRDLYTMEEMLNRYELSYTLPDHN